MKNIPVSFQSGVHTFEISQTLTKNQFTSVLNRAHARGKLIHNKKGQESYVLLDQQMPGITVTLYPIYPRRTYRVNIKVEPCRVLGSDDPTALYQYSKKSSHKLQRLCDRYLEMLCIPGSIETMIDVGDLREGVWGYGQISEIAAQIRECHGVKLIGLVFTLSIRAESLK